MQPSHSETLLRRYQETDRMQLIDFMSAQRNRIEKAVQRMTTRINVGRNDGMDYYDKHRETDLEVRR